MEKKLYQTDSQQLYIRLMTLCLMVAIAVTWGSFISLAKNKEAKEQVYKYYTSVQIESGDTLWELSNYYITSDYDSVHDYIKEVKDLNSLESDDIHEGQYLMLPYYSKNVPD